MGKAVIRQTGYVLAHAPDVLMWRVQHSKPSATPDEPRSPPFLTTRTFER
ncbi:hypothetical protein [Yokenella regensburgei]|nr:hypothetical protein [Yokenella regensburgei]QIU89481.1 hypothetical protein HEC60_09245 [Yokenella regensburgei]